MERTHGADPELIAKLRGVFGAAPPLRLAVLFGSAALGRRRPDSDLDVAILTDGPLESDRTRDLIADLAGAADADVDLVSIDQAPTLLKWRIAVDGIPLKEATPGEFARFQARAASEYLDFAPALAYHGEIFRRRLVEEESPR
jgi:predicted nucleotidyltransferase